MGTVCTVKLSHALMDLGFFCALGSTEKCATPGDEAIVLRGTCCAYDKNNGVQVVRDEEGRPWIKRAIDVVHEDVAALREFRIVHGAYVPHSNDGGFFINRVLPELMKKHG